MQHSYCEYQLTKHKGWLLAREMGWLMALSHTSPLLAIGARGYKKYGSINFSMTDEVIKPLIDMYSS